MDRIASFSVDHDLIEPGIYISRIDAGDYMDNLTMHTVEHMLATFLRNSEIGGEVIYFGPMGCRTGFYLLVRGRRPEEVLSALKKALADTVSYEGAVFGAARKECGNYRELDLQSAKKECRRYLSVLESRENDFRYAE